MTQYNALNGQNAYLNLRCVIMKSENGNDIDKTRMEEALSRHIVQLKMPKCLE